MRLEEWLSTTEPGLTTGFPPSVDALQANIHALLQRFPAPDFVSLATISTGMSRVPVVRVVPLRCFSRASYFRAQSSFAHLSAIWLSLVTNYFKLLFLSIVFYGILFLEHSPECRVSPCSH